MALASCSSNAAGKATTSGNATIRRRSMISRLSGSVSCSLRISSLRRKAGRRVARNEPRDVKRRRAASGLARARLRAHTEQFLGVGVPSAVAWRMARALRGWGQSRRWAWEHAMILLGDQAKGRADGYLLHAQKSARCWRGQPVRL